MKRILFAIAMTLGLVALTGSQAEAGWGYSNRGGYGHYGHSHNRGYGYGSYYGGYGTGYGYTYPRWHDTTHYDYHPGGFYRHGNHFHYQPGHYDLHRDGHWHY